MLLYLGFGYYSAWWSCRSVSFESSPYTEQNFDIGTLVLD